MDGTKIQKQVTCSLVRDSQFTSCDETEREGVYHWIKQEEPVVHKHYVDLKFLTGETEHLYENASLHGVDNYFQMLRRDLNMVERPIPRSSKASAEYAKIKKGNKKEIWNLYGAYNPKYVIMLIEIFRVYNNYVLTDKKAITKSGMKWKTPLTPAQKIGLVDHAFKVEDLLSNSPAKLG
jgi:hypothetical protein